MPPKDLRRLLFLVVLAPALAGPAAACAQEETPASDLTLRNFFSEGWNEPWAHRHRRTPDMALLRVTTNFLERELRLDYAYTSPSGNPKLRSTDFGNALVAYAVNRRLMLEVITNYQWNNGVSGSSASGPGGGALVRFQLVEAADKSYAVQARISAPNKGIGQTQTSLAYALAGWQDMHALWPMLGRLGLYYSIQYENLQGSHKLGARENDLSYAVSIAETWTEPTMSVFGNFTTFVEAFATTDLDGASGGKTVLSLTPGVRFWLLPRNSLIAGLDLPVSHGAPFSGIYRLTYIFNL